MKLGTETGSLVNHVVSSQQAPVPVVGGAATILYWTDRHAATIVKVTRCQVHVQRDIATRVDKNGQSESQQYTFQPDTSAPVQIFRKTKRGWKGACGKLYIGERLEYHDFSF